MRTLVGLLLLALSAAAQTEFEAASVKPSLAGESLSCKGGPGTDTPGTWRCSDMPLALVILRAFHFKSFEFDSHDSCCLARFDFDIRVAAGITKGQFDQMLQNLLRERFKLAFRYAQKEMPVYVLTVASRNGPKMTPSHTDNPGPPDEPWWILAPRTFDKDGYPVFSAGRGGPASGPGSHYRWTASNVSAHDIASTLADQLGRPVIDATGLTGRYDVDLKWFVDIDWALSERARAEIQELVGEAPETVAGPTLIRAVREQLGLELTSKRGTGKVVVIDHVDRVPTEN